MSAREVSVETKTEFSADPANEVVTHVRSQFTGKWIATVKVSPRTPEALMGDVSIKVERRGGFAIADVHEESSVDGHVVAVLDLPEDVACGISEALSAYYFLQARRAAAAAIQTSPASPDHCNAVNPDSPAGRA